MCLMSTEEFRKQTKLRRKRLGLTQAQFAEQVGVSFSLVSKFESGDNKDILLGYAFKIDSGLTRLEDERQRELSKTNRRGN